ncbi:HD domain-containing protein [Actinokineospora spheciospongiae]|uniref:HD domain-containing protein n=1 Tax=Actinokineospora spheciospongiae TaxID=909613 RepID=UPI000553D293|nr:HD domain-containing protein [Actinokineospora spheciospongiae]
MGALFGEAEDLVRRELATSQPRRYAHLQGALRRSLSVAPLFADTDAETLTVAALVHDIGYCDSAVDTGLHALDGARFLAGLGFPARICNLVAHHSCSYREAELRGLTTELAEWDDERTPLRDALWWVDMTTSPDGAVVAFSRRVAEIRERYGLGEVVTRFIQRAESELRTAVERTDERLSLTGLGQV